MQHVYLAVANADLRLLPPLAYELAASVRAEDVEEVFRVMVEHHEGLRARFVRDASGEWRQIIDPFVPRNHQVDFFDMSKLPANQRKSAIQGLVADLAQQTRVGQGQLCRVALFDRGDASRLMVILTHHLVSDYMSRIVFMEDFLRAHAQRARAEPCTLGRRTTSVTTWAETLARLAASAEGADGLSAWLEECAREDPLSSITATGSGAIPFSLSERETDGLLRRAPATFATTVDHVLAPVIGQALARWTERPSATFEWLHHGRSFLPDGVDLSRTVGLLTHHVPLTITLDPRALPSRLVSSFHEQHRLFARRGLFYNALAYYSADPDLRARLQRHPAAQIRVNFLGDLARAYAPLQDASFARSHFALGRTAEIGNQLFARINLDLRVVDGAMCGTVVYSGLEPAMVHRLVEHLVSCMRGFANFIET